MRCFIPDLENDEAIDGNLCPQCGNYMGEDMPHPTYIVRVCEECGYTLQEFLYQSDLFDDTPMNE